jgi:hypothetical protein
MQTAFEKRSEVHDENGELTVLSIAWQRIAGFTFCGLFGCMFLYDHPIYDNTFGYKRYGADNTCNKCDTYCATDLL